MAKKQKIDWTAPVVHQEDEHPSLIPEGMTVEEYVKLLTPGTKVKVFWWDRKGEQKLDSRRKTVKNVRKGAHCWLVSFEEGTAVNPDRIFLA